MENENEKVGVPIFNEDGSLREKEDFLKDMSEVYDQVESDSGQQEELIKSDSFRRINTLKESIDVQKTLTAFSFLERKIMITDEINSSLANLIYEKICFWNELDSSDGLEIKEREPIKIYINTPGGCLNSTFTIIDAIKNSKTPVHTITTGIGYSGGFFIGICGHKRYATENSSFLFHEGSGSFVGDAHKMLSQTKFYYDCQLKKIKNLVLDNTEITEIEYDKVKKDDWMFDAEDALKFGVIDEILTENY